MKMNIINLHDIETLPDSFIERLSMYDELFGAYEYFDEIKSELGISSLVQDIDAYCKQNLIVGFHYTRTNPKSILTRGLLVRSGEDIRKGFLKEHAGLFTQNELDTIKTAWEKHFIDEQKRSRDNRIWFTFTLTELGEMGVRDLLNNYGGEQVYCGIDELEGIDRKIKSIGEPLVVKCVLDPSKVVAYTPWGNIAISAYHRSVNLAADPVDSDGYQSVPVFPEELEVYRVSTDNALQLISC